MVTRAYGKALTDEEIEDVYAAAWAATLSALRDRGASMSDQELRAYVLTAVASHASKELRRRTRKPAGSLDVAHDQVVSDVHLPLPDEAAIGSESAGIARDVLTSLPARRRAVMLLRYGWGLSPKEICALVDGLSPRAYRKEVSKGVDQMIARLKLVETGEWCESREPLLRDYVAGTADEDARRQVEEHLGHCRACSEFAGRLSGHLHDLGAGIGLASTATIISGKAGVIERLAGLADSGRSAATTAVERGEGAVASVAASGAGRGSGAAGAGLLAKVTATGAAGKAALACVGTGAAATACVVAGVVPGVSLNGSNDRDADRDRAPAKVEKVVDRGAERTDADPVDTIEIPVAPVTPAAPESFGEGPRDVSQEDVGGSDEIDQEPDPAPEPSVPAPVAEFDPVAPATTSAPAPAPAPSGSTQSSGSSGSTDAGSADVGEEFGP